MSTRRSFLQSALLLPSLFAVNAFAQDNASASFADFESGDYSDWTITGDAFGTKPATDALFPGKVRGFGGKGYASTFSPRRGVLATGKAVSREFVIEKPVITFKIGGGNHPGAACLNLVVDGKVERTETGDGSAQLVSRTWDVSALVGKTARLEIVDSTQSDQRGYVMVDDIAFGDAKTQAFTEPKIEPAVRVKPVFLVPIDAKPPAGGEKALLKLRLSQTQAHYHDMLRGLDTFQIEDDISVGRLQEDTDKLYELAGTNDGRFQIQKSVLRVLFEMDKVNRTTCPFVYYVVITGIPEGRPDFANPINGGVNKGGGIVITYLSGLTNRSESVEPRRAASRNASVPGSFDLDACGYLLRTVSHELGHAFGLTHTNEYGYEGADAVSVMCHRQWKLIPEELQLLGMNKLIFPNFTFDPIKDVPQGYKLKPLLFVGAANVA